MSLCLRAPHASPTARSSPPPGPRFTHVKCAPSPSLAPFVDHYWVTRWDRRDEPPRTAALLLDPCVHLQVCDGRAEVIGLRRGLLRTRIEGLGCVAGVRFRPGGFFPFVQRPVAEWTDRVMTAAEVFDGAVALDGGWAQALTDKATSCEGDAAAHAAIATAHFEAFLGARLPARDETAEHVADLVTLIASSPQLRRIGDFVRASGRSERTLHRLFARYVGASPVWVIRRYRLKEAATRLTVHPPADVRTVAWDLGYADQAHFIRDFRATIGVTPGAYVRALG